MLQDLHRLREGDSVVVDSQEFLVLSSSSLRRLQDSAGRLRVVVEPIDDSFTLKTFDIHLYPPGSVALDDST